MDSSNSKSGRSKRSTRRGADRPSHSTSQQSTADRPSLSTSQQSTSDRPSLSTSQQSTSDRPPHSIRLASDGIDLLRLTLNVTYSYILFH